MRQDGFILAAGRVRSKKKQNRKKKNTKKSRRTQSTPRNPQQPGDRDHLETVRDATRFAEIGLVQLSQSVKTTNVTTH